MDQRLILQAERSEACLPLRRHAHLAYEVIAIERGEAIVTVGARRYRACAGMLVVLSCLEEHAMQPVAGGYVRTYLCFACDRLEELVPCPPLLTLFKNRPQGFCHCFSVPQPVLEGFASLGRAAADAEPFADELAAARILELLVQLYRAQPQAFPLPQRTMPKAVYDAQQYLEQHFQEPVTIAKLADALFINKYYLSHCFKEMTGFSPKQYLLMYRLSCAKQLLAERDRDVAAVAVQAGFQDTSGFIRSFRRQYGCTPGQYRRSLAQDAVPQKKEELL